MDQIPAANSSQPRRDNVTSDHSSVSNPKSKSQPNGVAAHLQSIAESLEKLVKVGNRIADAIENLDSQRPFSMNCKRAGKYIGVGEVSIKNLIRAKKLPDSKLFDKKGQVILVEDLEKLVREQRVAIDEEVNDPIGVVD